jgi:hypothetical protein
LENTIMDRKRVMLDAHIDRETANRDVSSKELELTKLRNELALQNDEANLLKQDIQQLIQTSQVDKETIRQWKEYHDVLRNEMRQFFQEKPPGDIFNTSSKMTIGKALQSPQSHISQQTPNSVVSTTTMGAVATPTSKPLEVPSSFSRTVIVDAKTKRTSNRSFLQHGVEAPGEVGQVGRPSRPPSRQDFIAQAADDANHLAEQQLNQAQQQQQNQQQPQQLQQLPQPQLPLQHTLHSATLSATGASRPRSRSSTPSSRDGSKSSAVSLVQSLAQAFGTKVDELTLPIAGSVKPQHFTFNQEKAGKDPELPYDDFWHASTPAQTTDNIFLKLKASKTPRAVSN